jgi:membrane-associated phospholipid phosphatase
MRPRSLLWVTAVCAASCVAAILFLDRPLAEFIHARGGFLPGLFISGTVFLERAFGWEISKYLLGFLVVGSGLLLRVLKKQNWLSGALLVIGVSHLLGRLTAGTLKNVFERLRPEELLMTAQSTGFFAAEGNSFPSAHAAHFWSLFFPLALFCKRAYWPWLLLVPVFISVARIGVNHHFLGDVFAGIGVAAFVTWCTQKGLQRSFRSSEALGQMEPERKPAQMIGN